MKRKALLPLAGTALLLALAVPLPAQLLAARDNPFAVGHHHLNVTDVGAHKRFWGDLLGGEAAMFGKTNVIKLPNTLLFLRVQDPSGENNGSTVNHLGFLVPDLHALVPKLKAAGIEIVTTEVVADAKSDIHHNTGQDVYMAFAKGPDGVRVELMENKALDGITSHHIHIFTEDDTATQAWYVKHFGGKPGMRGPFKKADVPGIELTFAKASGPVEPTKGRVVDHIGFEVDNLEAFCKGLESQGSASTYRFARLRAWAWPWRS